MDSILITIKKLLGIEAQDTSFDTDVIVHINSVLSDLTMLGVGPPEGFSIEDDIPTWSDFMSDITKFEAVKTYIYLRVRLLFDPPSSSVVVEAMKRDIDKWEWKLTVAAENKI